MDLLRRLIREEVINLWKNRAKKKKSNPFGGITNPASKGPSESTPITDGGSSV